MASVLQLILRSRKEGDAAKKQADELKGLTKEEKKARDAAKKLRLAQVALAVAVVAGTIAIGKQLVKLAEHGVEVERAETALVAYAGSSEEAARTTELMTAAAGGAMSRFDAMRNATRMLSMGLADNADEAAKLTEIAITLGSTMGKGPQAAIEDFTLMLANQSILRLDTFGISGAKVREIMADLAEEGIAPADRQARFLAATLEVAEEKMGLLEEAGYEAFSAFDQLKAVITDTKDQLALAISKGIEPLAQALLDLKVIMDANAKDTEGQTSFMRLAWEETGWAIGEIFAELHEKADEVRDSQQEMAEASYAAAAALEGVGEDAEFVATKFDVSYVAMRNASSAMGDIAVAAGTAGLSIDTNLTGSIGRFLNEMEFLIGGGMEIQEAFRQVQEAVEAGIITPEEGERFAEELFVAAESLQEDLGNISARDAAKNIRDQLGGSFTDAKKKLDAIDRGLGALEREIEILINIRTTGTIPAYQHGGSFMIQGPPGPDRVPVLFMGTAGERVDVTPAQQTTTHQDNRSMLQGANVNINDPVARETVFSWINEYFGA